MSVKFAPLHLPLERRLQTLAIVAYTLMIACGALSVLIFSVYALLYTTYLRWIYITYLTWVFTIDYNACDTGARPIKWVKNLKWWKYIADYFPINLVKLSEVELDPKRNYLFCCFPHGMMATGAFTAIITEARQFSKVFPDHTVHMNTLKANLLHPILRELFLSIGIVSASAESLNYILGKSEGGNISALIIGGAEEAYHSRPGHYRVVLNRRKGFIKIALQNGSPLVPVMSFGEPDILDTVKFEKGSLVDRFQLAVKKYFGFVPLLPVGRGIFQYNYGILPQRREINVVVGKPIDVPKVKQPSQKQIDDLHTEFMKQLTNLFETEKRKYVKNHEQVQLEIVE